MKSRIRVIIAIFLLACPLVPAQGKKTPPPLRIGVLFWHDSANDTKAFMGIKEGLRVARMAHTLTVVNAKQSTQAAQACLTKWREEKIDLVFTMGTRATLIGSRFLREIPLVFAAVTNPEAAGILKRGKLTTGRNITGASNWIYPRFLLREFRRIMPGLKRLGVLYDPNNPASRSEVEAATTFLSGLPGAKKPPPRGFKEIPNPSWRGKDWVGDLRANLTLIPITVNKKDDLAGAAANLAKKCDAIWAPIDYLVYQNLELITKTTDAHKVPIFSSSRKGIEQAVLGVTVDFRLLGLKAAAQAQLILEKGRNPGTLPLATLGWHQVVINLRAARRASFSVPLRVLCNAEEIIDGPQKPSPR